MLLKAEDPRVGRALNAKISEVQSDKFYVQYLLKILYCKKSYFSSVTSAVIYNNAIELSGFLKKSRKSQGILCLKAAKRPG